MREVLSILGSWSPVCSWCRSRECTTIKAEQVVKVCEATIGPGSYSRLEVEQHNTRENDLSPEELEGLHGAVQSYMVGVCCYREGHRQWHWCLETKYSL